MDPMFSVRKVLNFGIIFKQISGFKKTNTRKGNFLIEKHINTTNDTYYTCKVPHIITGKTVFSE
jgi:hypothetical protein